ncbi:hypothetical protein SH668x_000916 [Planctomicrobium sp. SH668]|uniref:hypothetical protein n=1 Tax=Planctomicrobium sp. SH668 TaxID=3448126 RepID=UPI003F5B9774
MYSQVATSLITPFMVAPSLAQVGNELTTSSIEWDLPYVWTDWIPIVLLLLAMGTTIWFALRDQRIVGRGWSIALSCLRLVFLATAIVVALNPHERTQTDAYRDSRVIVLVDKSQSMQQPETDPRNTTETPRTRSAAVVELLDKTPLIEKLREQHSVDVYAFDSDVSELLFRFSSRFDASDGKSISSAAINQPAENDVKPDWPKMVEPTGMTTRLGDSLDTLLVEAKSPTLSGVLLLSDGSSNAGRDVQVPRDRAKEQGARLVAVGVGSTEPPVNLEIARIIAPTDVQKGDAFELSAVVRGTGAAGKSVTVELLQQGPDDPEPTVVLQQDETLGEDGASKEFTFDLKPADGGTFEFTVRARLQGGGETREDDNQLTRSVNIFDRPMRVLIVAGGPSRDYRYARTILYRHPSMETSVWLQSASPGVSQESDELLYRFPDTIEALYEFDVLLAFDPDWSMLTPEQHQNLTNWISNEGGGLLAVAGDVFTPELAGDDGLDAIRKLYPVVLEEISLRLNSRESAKSTFPLAFTQEGQVAQFLKLVETGEEDAWSQFPGICLVYPTQGAKAGATVYAEFSDPLSRGNGGQPIVFAGQRYGQGQVLYVGSPELWRLRSVDTAYLERLWTKFVRKAAEGRSKRGLQRGMFLLDGREFVLGQTIPLRVRALTPQFQPLVSDVLTVDAFTSGGAPVVPSPQLRRDPSRPAEFAGDFRPQMPGRYRLEFDLPDSSEKVTTEIDMQLPRQEAASLVQDVEVLKRLVDGTAGEYLRLEDAVTRVADLFPNKGERVIVDQRIQELWDRGWMMGLLALLLSLEWLTRKLLKLA